MLLLPPLDSLRFFEAAARQQGFARAAIGRPMLIARELESRTLVPVGPPAPRATRRTGNTVRLEEPVEANDSEGLTTLFQIDALSATAGPATVPSIRRGKRAAGYRPT